MNKINEKTAQGVFAMFHKFDTTDRVGIAAWASVAVLVLFNIVILTSETGVPVDLLSATHPLVALA